MGKIRWSDRYDSLFQYWAQVHEMPWRILKQQAFKESGFDPDAVSSQGAMGLMQFMKMTAKEELIGSQGDVFDPEEAIKGAARYDMKLYTRAKVQVMHEDPPVDELDIWRFAICGYNCGWGYVKTALQQLITRGVPVTWMTFEKELPTVVYNGKRPMTKECLPYAAGVVPDATFLLP